jgi:hypothetical protein
MEREGGIWRDPRVFESPETWMFVGSNSVCNLFRECFIPIGSMFPPREAVLGYKRHSSLSNKLKLTYSDLLKT